MDMFSYLMGKSSGGGKGALVPIVVDELPETGETGKLYLVSKQEETENDVFDEYLWVDEDWELIGTAKIDISGKQDKMQFTTMPSASASNVGQIVQYTGTTNANYTNGYFYICMSDGGDSATYSWTSLTVQDIQKPILNSSNVYSINIFEFNSDGLSIEDKKRLGEIITNSVGSRILFYVHSGGSVYGFQQTDVISVGSGAFSIRTTPIGLIAYERQEWLSGYYCVINGNWNNGIFTVTSTSVSSYNQTAYQVLKTNNTKAYTPTGDYNPATKKYVDDSIASASGSKGVVITTSNYNSSATVEALNNEFQKYKNGESYNVLCEISATYPGRTLVSNVYFAKTNDDYVLWSPYFILRGSVNDIMDYVCIEIRLTVTDETITRIDVPSLFSSLKFGSSTGGFIPSTENAKSYNVIGNYVPAHKKYVDKAVANATIQVTSMPTASADNLGKVYQYIGTTDNTYTNGYFYTCIATSEEVEGETVTTYSWENLSVQGAPEVFIFDTKTFNTASNREVLNKVIEKLENQDYNFVLYCQSYTAKSQQELHPAFDIIYADGLQFSYIRNLSNESLSASIFGNSALIERFRYTKNGSSITRKYSMNPRLVRSNYFDNMDNFNAFSNNQIFAHDGYTMKWVNFAENLAPSYSSSSTYNVGDYVTYNNILYVCNTAISTTEAFDSSKWTQTSVANILGNINNALATLTTPSNNGGN